MKLLLAFAALVVAVSAEEYLAIVKLDTVSPNRVSGNITFSQTDDGPVHITGTVSGLSPGKHGFHVHERGDIADGACANTKGHFNPHKNQHGAPEDENRHVGDLGNIIADQRGFARVDITDSVITLCSGPNSIIGRGLVIHSAADDLGKGGETDSLTTGHAGSRVACGVIGVLSPSGSWNSASSAAASVFTVTAVTAVNILLLRN